MRNDQKNRRDGKEGWMKKKKEWKEEGEERAKKREVLKQKRTGTFRGTFRGTAADAEDVFRWKHDPESSRFDRRSTKEKQFSLKKTTEEEPAYHVTCGKGHP